MNKTPSYLTNIFSIILLALFTIIFVTENTNFINNNYKSSIISTLEKNINLRIKIDDIDVEWNGLEQKIIFLIIKLIDKETNKEIISGESLISKLDLYQSIIQNRFVPKEFNIINTKLSLKYSNRNLYFKN